jgi:tetratricopeptide (TPR) repeat protein
MFSHLILGFMLLTQEPPPAAANWKDSYEAGKAAFKNRNWAEAAARLEESLKAAGAETTAVPGMLDAGRLLATVRRLRGEFAQAEELLARLSAIRGEHEPDSPETAAVFSELAVTQRAQGKMAQALDSVERAVAIRRKQPAAGEDLAQDLSTAALLRVRLEQGEPAVEALKRALEAWDSTLPGDLRCLPVIEALAGLYRDAANYADAEPLLLRSLNMREAANGADAAELISTVDSLAYVYFGLKRYNDAEPLYKRLLALWEKNASPEHPMVALTLDKMAEFYAAQERYAEAEELVRRALAIRANLHIGSMRQTGRIYLMEAKLEEADDLYGRAVKIGDLAQTPDEIMDPLLRLYARVLRELKRPAAADALERRAKDALLRKADREGRRTPPVSAKPAPAK